MSKNKQKTFLTGFGVVTGAAALGLLWMALGAGTNRDAKADEVNKKIADIKALKSASLYPKSEFADNIKKRAADLVVEAEKLHGTLQKMQVPWEGEVEGTAVQGKIGKYKDALIAEAKGRGQTLPSGFAMGLERFVDTAPPKAASPRLNFITESMNKALVRLLGTGVNSVDKIYVVEGDWEKAGDGDDKGKKPVKAAPKPTKPVAGAAKDPKAKPAPAPALPEAAVYNRFRVLIQFTGAEQNVQDALNSLLTSGEGEPFFVVNSFRAESAIKQGPSKESAFNPEPIKEDAPAGGAEAAAPSAAEQIDPEVRDVRFILGSEKMTVFLDADLLLFLAADGPDGVKASLTKPATSSK